MKGQESSGQEGKARGPGTRLAMARPLAGLALLAISLLSAPPALSADTTPISVLGLENHEAPDSLLKDLEAELSSKISGLDYYKLLPLPAMPLDEMKMALGCMGDSPDCFATIGENLSATQVIYGSVFGSKTAYLVSLSLFDVKAKKVLMGQTGNLQGSKEQILGAFRAMLDRLLRVRPGEGSLVVDCSTSGVRVLLDGRAMGEAPLELSTPAGQHRLQANAPGYLSWETTARVEAGAVSRVEISLIPASAAEDLASPSSMVIGKWTTLGTTLALGAAAVTMSVLTLNAQNEYNGMSMADPDLDSLRTQGETFATTANVLYGVTTASAVTSLVLFIVDYVKGPPKASPKAEAPP